jgi:16S rRNA (uracil1498-N3)-methyltransferase
VLVHRFFAPAIDPGDDIVQLPRDEAEHLTRVLRLGVGDTITVFDGRGREFLARVVAATSRAAAVQMLSRVDPAAELPVAITLVQSVLKGDKMDEIVRDAVMLGASAIQPLVTTRAETTVRTVLRTARLDRWRRVALASVKQSRRAILPEIRTPLTLDDYMDEPAPAMRLILVEPSAAVDAARFSTLRHLPVPADAAVLVGPEGGWTENELVRAVARGLRPMTLGPRTLRADAVPVAALSVLACLWDDPR